MYVARVYVYKSLAGFYMRKGKLGDGKGLCVTRGFGSGMTRNLYLFGSVRPGSRPLLVVVVIVDG
jgi:hypothetical protein